MVFIPTIPPPMLYFDSEFAWLDGPSCSRPCRRPGALGGIDCSSTMVHLSGVVDEASTVSTTVEYNCSVDHATSRMCLGKYKVRYRY